MMDGQDEVDQSVHIHPTSIVESRQVGANTRIWAFAHVLEGARIGSNCNIGDHCFIESGVAIGDNVTVKNGNMIWAGIHLEEGVFVGPGVSFTNDRHPRSPRLPQAERRYADREWLLPTVVRQGASLGAGAVILAGITIGEFAVVGAGAVVTRSVEPYSVVVGNPARHQGWACQCGQPLRFQGLTTACGQCGSRFALESGSVRPKPAHDQPQVSAGSGTAESVSEHLVEKVATGDASQ